MGVVLDKAGPAQPGAVIGALRWPPAKGFGAHRLPAPPVGTHQWVEPPAAPTMVGVAPGAIV